MSVAATMTRRSPASGQRLPGDYDALRAAINRLSRNPDDENARLLAVRGYLALHLMEPARDLMDSWVGGHADSAEICSLRSVVLGLSAESVDWSQLDETFRNNLAVLRSRRVGQDLENLCAEVRQSHRLFRDRNGQYQVYRRIASGAHEWLPTLSNHEADDADRPDPDDLRSKMPGPYLFDGLGCGRYFERIHAATSNTFLGYGCAIYLVEPDARWLTILLHLRDWTKPLADPRVLLFFGDNWRDQLQRAWDADFDLPFPHQAFSSGPQWVNTSVVSFVQAAATAREKAIADSLATLNDQYAARDLKYWAKRFAEALDGTGKPLRILSAVSTHTTFLQHSVRDAKRALESLGHQVVVLTEDRLYTVIGPLTYHTAIRTLDPDVFLMLDHLRPECETVIPRNLPILTWDQDQLPQVFTPQNLARIAPHDFVAGCSKFHCVSLGCNPRQFLNARVPTCPEQFGGPPLTDKEFARFACDVSYVSHASQTPKAFHEEERAVHTDPAVRRLLDTMYELLPEQLQMYRVVDGGVMQTVLDEACRRCGVQCEDEASRGRFTKWYLWRLGDRMFRHEALEWVAAWARRTNRSFRIYGNGWDKHPTLARFAAGPAENGRELLCVYRASKINLQLMPAGFVHQRSLDGLAAGGFFLGRCVPDDLRGNTLKALVARCDESNITTTEQLLSACDPHIASLLRSYVGDRLGHIDHSRDDLLTHLRINAELIYPDEVFPDFSSILFDSNGEFERLADRFLADEEVRRQRAHQMREVVIRHYAYKPAMQEFLMSMSRYLAHAADNGK